MESFNYLAARQAGYSEEEIGRFLANQYSFDYDGAVAEGYKPQEIVDFLSIRETKPVAAPEVEERTVGNAVQDLAASFGVGTGQLVGLLGSAYGLTTGDMDNRATRFGANTAEFWEARKTPILKAAEDLRQARVDAAEGEFEKAGVAIWETIKNPMLLVSEVTKQVPNLAVGGLAGLGAKTVGKVGAATLGKELSEQAVTKIGVGAATGSELGLSSADFGQSAYDQLMAIPDEVWAANPDLQERTGGNPDLFFRVKREMATELAQNSAIAGGIVTFGLNKLPGAKTIEKVLGGDALTGTRTRRALTGLAGETVSEGAEEAATQLSANIAQAQIDPNTDLTAGLGQAGGLGALVGGAFGAGAGALSPQRAEALAPSGLEGLSVGQTDTINGNIVSRTQSGFDITTPTGVRIQTDLSGANTILNRPVEEQRPRGLLRDATNAGEAVSAAEDIVGSIDADIEALERDIGQASTDAIVESITPAPITPAPQETLQSGRGLLAQEMTGTASVTLPPVEPAPTLTLEALASADISSMPAPERQEFLADLNFARTAELPAQRQSALTRAAETYGRTVGPIQQPVARATPEEALQATRQPTVERLTTAAPDIDALLGADTRGLDQEDRADFNAQLAMARTAEPGPVQTAALNRAAEIYGRAIGPIQPRTQALAAERVTTAAPDLNALLTADTRALPQEDRDDFNAQLAMARTTEPGPAQTAALNRAAEIYGRAIGPIQPRTQGSARPEAPRPTRLLGRATETYSAPELQSIANNTKLPEITRRGAQIELRARSDFATSFNPTMAPMRTQPLDVSTAPVQEAISENFIAIPETVPVVAAQPVAGQSAGQQARASAQRTMDRWAASQNMPSPVKFADPSPELEKGIAGIVELLGQQFGAEVVPFSDTSPNAINGVQLAGKTMINVGSTQLGVPNTAFHELFHFFENLAEAEKAAGKQDGPAQELVEQLYSIFDDVEESGKRSYIENLLYVEELAGLTGDAREAFILSKLNAPLTRSEMIADFMNNRSTDKNFLQGLAKADPTGFEAFVKRWLAVLDNMLDKLRGAKGKARSRLESVKVDKYIKDLNRAKLTAQSALINYRKATGQAPVATPAAAPVAADDLAPTSEDVVKAEAFEEKYDILPYTSRGQLEIKFSVKESGKYGNHPVLGIPVNKNGTVSLYFPTTNDTAKVVRKDKVLRGETPSSDRIYLTNESSAPKVERFPGLIAQPLGGANVLVQVDPNLVQVLTEYPDGRKDFFMPIAEGAAFKAKMTKLFTLNVPRGKGLSPDRTLLEIQKSIATAATKFKEANRSDRKALVSAARKVLRAEHNVGTLLGENGKLEKTRIGDYGLTYDGQSVSSLGLGLASAQKINDKQKLTSCPQSAICEDLCLGETSGQNMLYGGIGQFRSGPRLSQYLKTEAMVLHPEEFTTVLMAEIDSFRVWSAKEEYKSAIRLNVTSDFVPKILEPIITAFPDVMFYDYTKMNTDVIAPNHHLTYSSTGASQVVNGETIINPESNWPRMVQRMRNGQNVAMAFTVRNDMPDFVQDEISGERFQVWNGDNYDARFLDPKPGEPGNTLNKGMIIGLTNKDRTGPTDTAAKRHRGFFLEYDRARDGDTLIIKDQSALKETVARPVKLQFSRKQGDVLARDPRLEQAAQGMKEGTVTSAEYRELVNAIKPVTPYTEAPDPAKPEDIRRALTSDKLDRIGVPGKTLKAGDPVGLRLDIPAYANHGVWVVSVHDQIPGFAAGKSIGYESVAAVTNPTFGVVESAALNIASGKPKATIAVMKGDWKPISPKQAAAAAKLAMKSDSWVQVGMDPTRHAYFYDRASMEPVVSADEAIQVGPLVLAKNPVYGNKEDFRFSRKQGDAPSQQRGINVRNDGDNLYADLIVDGEKTMESRNTNSLRAYVGQTVGIIRTGGGPARLIGSVKIGEPIQVDEQEFRELEPEHLVPKDSTFDIKPGSTKFLYPLTEAQRFDEERAVDSRGIVARDVAFSRSQTNTPAFKRPYEDAPNSLMGFRKGGPQKEWDDQNYMKEIIVRVTWPDGRSLVDAQRGLNRSHAEERARRNWEGAEIETLAYGDRNLADKPEWADALSGSEDTPAFSRSQTDTPEFKRWFGDSKVVDADGQPLVLYHGTPLVGTTRAFTTFQESDAPGWGRGIYMTDNKQQAGEEFGGELDKVMPVYVSIKNPYTEGPINIESTKAWKDYVKKQGKRTEEDPDYNEETDYIDSYDVIEENAYVLNDALRELGYDGIIAKNSNNIDGLEVVVFSPTQIKSATDNAGTFDPTNPDIRFSVRQPPFYSSLKRTVADLPERMRTQPAKQWVQWLTSPSNQSRFGFKKEEVTWSGVEEYLNMRGKDKVTADDIIQYLNQNNVTVEDVVLGGEQEPEVYPLGTFRLPESGQTGDMVYWREEMRRIADDEDLDFDDLMDELVDVSGEPMDPLDDFSDQSEVPKYANYVAGQGDNYREVLITLPYKGGISGQVKFISEDVAEEFMEELSMQGLDKLDYGADTSDRSLVVYDHLTEPEYNRFAEVRDQWATESTMTVMRTGGDPKQKRYMSSHWYAPNVLAHLRVDDRATAAGESVLFVNEVQSDWGQDARKKGIKPQFTIDELIGQRIAAMGVFLDSVSSLNLPDKYDITEFVKKDSADNAKLKKLLSDNGVTSADTVANVLTSATAYRDARAAVSRVVGKPEGTIPNAPFIADTESWATLAIKRAVVMAVDGEYDKVAFVNGEQAAEMFDLSKRVGLVRYRSRGDDSYGLEVYDPEDNIVHRDNALSADEIQDVIGKELAQKIVNDDGTPDANTGWSELAGLDLKVGGEGMVGFYDGIVPNLLRKLAKKFGGTVAVEPIPISPGNVTNDQLTLTITDDLRKQVQDVGLPLFSRKQNIFGQTMPPSNWTAEEGKMDDAIYSLQDKLVDTKRVLQGIRKAGNTIADKWDGYLQETLYHGRTATRTTDFTDNELAPLIKGMDAGSVSMKEFDTYLHNRHAQERNAAIARINPALPDAGSGIKSADARAYLAAMDPNRRATLESLAQQVDAITEKTRQALLAGGLESQAAIDAWESTYSQYVPLMREELDFDSSGGKGGSGAGFNVKGSSSRRATGSSTRAVVDILANIAMQRERAIVRAEKNRVSQAMYGLAIQNPNPGFWLPINPDAIKDKAALAAELVTMGINPLQAQNIAEQPTQSYVDPRSGLVTKRVNSFLADNPNVLVARVNGKDRFLLFNSQDERANRMVTALKNMDADQLGRAMSMFAVGTRWFASVNTQYNPIFGLINFARDVQGGLLNLSTTAIAGKQKDVTKNTIPALIGIYRDLRSGTPSQWATLWEDFQQAGGQTGFRDQFSQSEERGIALQKELDALRDGTAKKAGKAVLNWLSDYNTAMENAVRLSAYKVALDSGVSKDRAASLAKNLTVNFNKKGQVATQMGALYAFFNASVQGSARLLETLKGPAGKKIVYGGLLLGSAQALAMAAAGFDEDEPPQFLRERNIIIPIGDKKYLAVPMPLGFNVIPNTGRVLTEWAMSGFENTGARAFDLAGSFVDMFNPIGNAGFSGQTIAPTIADPAVALFENRDWSGNPISKENFNSLAPTPGYTRAKDTASFLSKELSYYLNLASGGTEFAPGALSPTPDQLDYVWGQLTGGLGREIMKTEQTVTALATGEDLPPFKIPLFGRLYGDTSTSAADSNRFYENIRRMNIHKEEIQGRQESRRPVGEYYRDNPEARLVTMAGSVYRDVQQMRNRKREMVERGASRESVRIMEQRIASRMRQFNDQLARM